MKTPTPTLASSLDALTMAVKMIGNPQRLELLMGVCQKPLTYEAMREITQMERPAMDRHVRMLVECGLIVRDRAEGNRVFVVGPNMKPVKNGFSVAAGELKLTIERI